MERLAKIRRQVETAYDSDVMSKRRLQHITDSRIVFAKVAKMFRIKQQDIADYLGKNHATVTHYIKTHAPSQMQEIILNTYEACLTDSESIQRMAQKMSEMDYLTENEKAYRKLTAAQRKVYDQRVSAILKMI